MSVTTDRGSQSTSIASAASSARARLPATTLAPQEARVLAPADGGAEILRAHRALLVAGGKDPVEPRRHHGHEEAGDRDAGDDAHDGEKDERDDGGRNGAQVVHEISSLDFLMSRIGGRWPISGVLSILVMCVMRATMSR